MFWSCKKSIWNVLFISCIFSACFSQTSDLLSTDTIATSIAPQGTMEQKTDSSTFFYVNEQQRKQISSKLGSQLDLSAAQSPIAVGLDTVNNRMVVVSSAQNGEITHKRFEGDIYFSAKRIWENSVAHALAKHNQRGRAYLLSRSTLLSLGTFTSSFSMLSDGYNSTAQALALGASGASLYGMYALTQDVDLGYGKVTFINHWSTAGAIFYPAILGELANSEKVYAVTSLAGYAGGMALGLAQQHAKISNHDFGRASFTSFSGWSAAALAPALYAAFAGDSFIPKFALALSGVAMPAGYYAGYQFISDRPMSPGRSVMVTNATLLGALTGISIVAVIEPESTPGSILPIVATSIGGGAFGYGYQYKKEYSFMQGAFTALSTAAGGLVGIGLGIGLQSWDLGPLLMSMGGWAGFLVGAPLSESLIDPSSRDENTLLDRLEFDIGGLALAPVLLSKSNKEESDIAVPLTQLRLRF